MAAPIHRCALFLTPTGSWTLPTEALRREARTRTRQRNANRPQRKRPMLNSVSVCPVLHGSIRCILMHNNKNMVLLRQ